MPRLIKHIDAIAREKQRTVLSIEFHPENWGIHLDEEGNDVDSSWCDYNFVQDQRRTDVLAWLDENGALWQKCGPVASECGFRSYLGEVYIDVPFDYNDPQFQIIHDYLEYTDGTLRDKNVRFYYLSLDVAIKNVHHDEPGFWKKWAEYFEKLTE